MTATQLRSFVAVPLPAPMQNLLCEVTRQLQAELQTTLVEGRQSEIRQPEIRQSEIRWTRKVENLHITMKFLGNVAVDRLGALTDALVVALANVPPLSLNVSGVSAFPDVAHANVIWAGIDDADGRLGAIAQIVEGTAAAAGFAREKRPFRGHVTLGRCRRQLDLRPALASWRGRTFGVVTVRELHIYESQLARRDGRVVGAERPGANGGSTYHLRGRAPLAAPQL